MNTKGYFGVGCQNMKTSMNYGSLLRTAHILGANFIFMIGNRFKPQASDVNKSWKQIPLFHFNNFEEFNNNRPYDCPLIGVEMTDNAIPLDEFKHPTNAMYLLGAEDNGLTKEAITYCQSIVYLPGDKSLNVSVAGSIVLYDRYVKINKNND